MEGAAIAQAAHSVKKPFIVVRAMSDTAVINTRTIKRQSTLISTNLDLQEFKNRYTERIMSRIVDSYLIFNLYGDNIRYVKRMKSIARNKR